MFQTIVLLAIEVYRQVTEPSKISQTPYVSLNLLPNYLPLVTQYPFVFVSHENYPMHIHESGLESQEEKPGFSNEILETSLKVA